MSQSQKHLDLLDYMRATAIVSVVAFHCLLVAGAQIYWNTWVRNLNVPISNLLLFPLNLGSLGVAIFFVVSGFCIHLSFQQQGKKYLDFYVRRFFRIYPAYLVAVLLFAFLVPKTSLSFSDASSDESWKQLIAHLLLIHNFWPGTFTGINASFWSLAIEVQLYLIYPLLLFLVARFGWKRTLLFLAIIESVIHIVTVTVLFKTATNPHFLSQYPQAISNIVGCIYDLGRSPLAYWFSWSLGAMIADYYLQNKPLPLANVSPMIWVGGIIACFVFRPLSEFMFMMGCLLTATVLSHLLTGPVKTLSEGRLWKTLGKIGVCSYSLYLLHEPILFAVPIAWLNSYGNLAKVFFLSLVAVAILMLSWLAYVTIEAPSIKLGKILVKGLKPRTSAMALD